MTFQLKAQRPKLTENDVERGIKDLLELSGWKVVRLQSGVVRLPYDRQDGKPAFLQMGQQGIPDWLAVHARLTPGVIWYEAKAPGNRPSRTRVVKTQTGKNRVRKGQQEYLRELQLGGFLAGWFDSLEMFRAFYRRVFEAGGPVGLKCPACNSLKQVHVPNPPGAWLCLGCRRYWGGEEF